MRHNDMNKGGIWPVVKKKSLANQIINWDRNNKKIQKAHEVLDALLGWTFVVILLVGVWYL